MDFKKFKNFKDFDWKKFIKDTDWKEFCRKNARYIAGGAAIFILAVMLIKFGVVDHKKGGGGAGAVDKKEQTETKVVGTKEEAKEKLESSPLKKDAYPNVNTLVTSYFKDLSDGNVTDLKKVVDELSPEEEQQIAHKKEYIEKYDNISCYTKPGPIKDSYIVFAYYETKFMNIKTLVPGLMPLYVCTAEDGGLFIVNSELEEDVQTYIETVKEDQDVLDLVTQVNEKYAKAQESDAALKKFVARLEAAAKKAQADSAKAEADAKAKADAQAKAKAEAEKKKAEEAKKKAALAKKKAEEAKKKAALAKKKAAQAKKQQSAADKKKAEEEAATKAARGANGRIVKLSGAVNVRARMSEDSKLIFTCAPGALVKVHMDYREGWSKVTVYDNGKVGYVKTMYLK